MTDRKKPGPATKPPELNQSARISERVSPGVLAAYKALGGKAWLVPAIMRARKVKT